MSSPQPVPIGPAPDPPPSGRRALPRRPRQAQLAESHLWLVDSTMRRLLKRRVFPAWIERDEIRGAGYLGLMQAATRFDPEGGASFPTFARYRILGEMLELVRKRQFRDATHEPLPERADNHAVEISDPHGLASIAAIEAALTVSSILARVGRADRRVLKLCYLRERGIAGVAAKRRISRARAGESVRRALDAAKLAA